MMWVAEQYSQNENKDLQLRKIIGQNGEQVCRGQRYRNINHMRLILKMKNQRYGQIRQRYGLGGQKMDRYMLEEVKNIKKQEEQKKKYQIKGQDGSCQQLEFISKLEKEKGRGYNTLNLIEKNIKMNLESTGSDNYAFYNTQNQSNYLQTRSFNPILQHYPNPQISTLKFYLNPIPPQHKNLHYYQCNIIPQNPNRQQKRRSLYQQILKKSQQTYKNELTMLFNHKETNKQQRKLYHKIVKDAFQQKEQKEQLNSPYNNIWYKIYLQFQYRNKYLQKHTIQGNNTLWQIINDLNKLNLTISYSQPQTTIFQLQQALKTLLQTYKQYLDCYSHQMTIIQKSIQQTFLHNFIQNNEQIQKKINLIEILNVAKDNQFIVRLVLNIVGLYRLINSNKNKYCQKQITSSYIQFKHKLSKTLHLNPQNIQYYIYLYDYTQIIQLGINTIINQEQYLHILIILQNFIFLLGINYQFVKQLMVVKLKQYAQLLFFEGKMEYVYYLALVIENYGSCCDDGVKKVKDFIFQNNIYEILDWQGLKTCINRANYNKLVYEVLLQQSQFCNNTKLISNFQLLLTLLFKYEHNVEMMMMQQQQQGDHILVFNWLVEMKDRIQIKQRYEIYYNYYNYLINDMKYKLSNSDDSNYGSYRMMIQTIIKITQLQSYQHHHQPNCLINFIEQQSIPIFDIPQKSIISILSIVDRHNALYFDIIVKYLRGIRSYRRIVRNDDDLRYDLKWLKGLHMSLYQRYFSYNLLFEQNHRKIVDQFHQTYQ